MQTTSAAGVTYDYGDRYSDPNRSGDARRNSNKKGGHVIVEMWESSHEIARRLLLGQKNVDIARDLGCTAQTVSNVRNSPVVKDKLAIMSAARDAGTIDLAREIADLAPLALQRVKEALETGQVMGRELNGISILKEANQLLDREIGKPTQRVDTRNIHGHFTMEDLDRIKARAKELAPLGFDATLQNGIYCLTAQCGMLFTLSRDCLKSSLRWKWSWRHDR